ncbi:hypothetical protein FBY34_7730 [Streptomyces sp. SLBN-115]|nr:hypothetical protein FBY34_7730 [Streptomyces sp. SLBN-115]
MSDLRPFSEENGREVGGEYVENDVSAHSGEERPAYDRLTADAIEAAREPGVRVLPTGFRTEEVQSASEPAKICHARSDFATRLRTR